MSRLVRLLSIKVLAAGAMFATQILPAKCLSVQQFGTFSYLNSLVSVLVFVAIWGTDRYCVKEVSLAAESENKTDIGKRIFACYTLAFINLLFIGLGLWFYLTHQLENEFTLGIWGATFLILLGRSYGLLNNGITRGRNEVVLSELVFALCRPVLFLIPLVFLYFLDEPTSPERLTFVLNMLGISFVAVALVLTFINTSNPLTKLDFKFDSLPSLYFVSFFFLLVGLGIPLLNNMSTIQLGELRPRQEVALFSAAAKLVNLILLALVSANLLIAPKLSPLYEANEIGKMTALIRNNNLTVALLTIFPTLIVIFFPQMVLSLFGEQYTPAAPLLQMLAIGQIVSVACGPVVLTATLVGMQRQTAYTVLVLCGVNWLLCQLLIPVHGSIGAVIASVFSGVALNATMAFYIWNKTGLNVTMSNLMVANAR